MMVLMANSVSFTAPPKPRTPKARRARSAHRASRAGVRPRPSARSWRTRPVTAAGRPVAPVLVAAERPAAVRAAPGGPAGVAREHVTPRSARPVLPGAVRVAGVPGQVRPLATDQRPRRADHGHEHVRPVDEEDVDRRPHLAAAVRPEQRQPIAAAHKIEWPAHQEGNRIVRPVTAQTTSIWFAGDPRVCGMFTLVGAGHTTTFGHRASKNDLRRWEGPQQFEQLAAKVAAEPYADATDGDVGPWLADQPQAPPNPKRFGGLEAGGRGRSAPQEVPRGRQGGRAEGPRRGA